MYFFRKTADNFLKYKISTFTFLGHFTTRDMVSHITHVFHVSGNIIRSKLPFPNACWFDQRFCRAYSLNIACFWSSC